MVQLMRELVSGREMAVSELIPAPRIPDLGFVRLRRELVVGVSV